MVDRIYLDYNATTPIYPAVVELMAGILAIGGNASSVHAEGRAARSVIENARQQVCDLVGGDIAGLVFTSCGTEACNLALQTRQAPAGEIKRLIVSEIEHPAVMEPAKASGLPIIMIGVDSQGCVDLDALDKVLEDETPALVAIMAANNETGVIQPIAQIGEQVRAHGSVFFCDGIQAAGKMPLSMWRMNIDLLSLSAHKIGGPAGVGALVAAPHAIVASHLHGGGQELRRRAGTENISGIVGFGLAAELTAQNLEDFSKISAMRDALESALIDIAPQARFFGTQVERLPNTSCFAVSGLPAEMLVMALDLDGIAISAGSACSSGKVTQSHVLSAMGIEDALSQSAIRVSLGRDTQPEEIEKFLAIWSRVIGQQSQQSKAAE